MCAYEVYQLKHDIDNYEYLLFESLKRLEKHGYKVESTNYKKVYEGNLDIGVNISGLDVCEELFKKFNMNKPVDFRGHSMSVSDVVVLSKDGTRTAYYCDDHGFTTISF